MDRFLVDGMNVIGSRPDGWWRDVDAAVLRLIPSLAAWRASAGADVVAVFDGCPPSGLDERDIHGLQVVFAGQGRAADDEIVRRVGIDPDAASIRVVTSDRLLAERVRAAGAGEVMGAGRFRRLLDAFDP
jgi:predicted RNA-binding protein with PIN domain